MVSIEEVKKQIGIDFGYNDKDLEGYEFINISESPEMAGNIYWDSRGIYVLFEVDNTIWYCD